MLYKNLLKSNLIILDRELVPDYLVSKVLHVDAVHNFGAVLLLAVVDVAGFESWNSLQFILTKQQI